MRKRHHASGSQNKGFQIHKAKGNYHTFPFLGSADISFYFSLTVWSESGTLCLKSTQLHQLHKEHF